MPMAFEQKHAGETMSEIKVRVSTNNGQLIGYFISPQVEHLCGQDYEVSGTFVDENGRPYDRIEFNPEAVPYELDVSAVQGLNLQRLHHGYVHRGRQPVRMSAKTTAR
jgi:hypothetical protein